jgi:hypothetical protein
MAGRGRHDGVGRQKGTPNKKSLALLERAQALGVDPFEVLLRFAKGDWQGLGYDSPTEIIMTKTGPMEKDRITPDHRLSAASQACQYLYPKRKAIEVTEKPDEDRPLQYLSNEELDKL